MFKKGTLEVYDKNFGERNYADVSLTLQRFNIVQSSCYVLRNSLFNNNIFLKL